MGFEVPFYMRIIARWCIGSPSACGTTLHSYYCRSITATGACGNMLHTYYSRSVNPQTMCLWDHFAHLLLQVGAAPDQVTHLLVQVGAAPDQVPVGPCCTLIIAGRCGTRPSACETMLHTYCRRSVRHQPSACGTMLHTYYCRSVHHQTKCLWDHVTYLLLQVHHLTKYLWEYVIHLLISRSVNLQTMCLWDLVTHLILQVNPSPDRAWCVHITPLLLQFDTSLDQVPVGPCYTVIITDRNTTWPCACCLLLQSGWSVTRPSACGTMLHTYYCRSVQHQTKCLWYRILHMFSRHSHQSVGSQDHKNRRRQTHTTSVGCRTQCHWRGVAGSDKGSLEIHGVLSLREDNPSDSTGLCMSAVWLYSDYKKLSPTFVIGMLGVHSSCSF